MLENIKNEERIQRNSIFEHLWSYESMQIIEKKLLNPEPMLSLFDLLSFHLFLSVSTPATTVSTRFKERKISEPG